jgi:F-type H+-transporting ATPase subunit gamma
MKTPAAIARRSDGAVPQRRDRRGLPLYNEFKSVMAQKLVKSRRCCRWSCPSKAEPVDYIFEQPPLEMLEPAAALRGNGVFRALLESAAAEHAARMTAMEAATSNAEMIDNPDAVHEPRAPGQHHQGNYRSGQRRRAAE